MSSAIYSLKIPYNAIGDPELQSKQDIKLHFMHDKLNGKINATPSSCRLYRIDLQLIFLKKKNYQTNSILLFFFSYDFCCCYFFCSLHSVNVLMRLSKEINSIILLCTLVAGLMLVFCVI